MPFRFLVGLVGLGTCMLLLGCGVEPADTSSSNNTPSDAAHDHDHTALGPHGGDLIVLGEEEYHAELTHDEASHTVAVYLLDAAAKEVVSSGPAEITLQIFEDGDFADHALRASGDDGTFAVVDESLCDILLHSEDVKGRVHATIAGKEYVGIIEHAAHDHDGHDQEGDGDGHDHEGDGHDQDGDDHGDEGDDHDGDAHDH